jgi:hypothetical protein
MSSPRSLAACAAALLLVALPARATEQIWTTGWSNYTTVESELCGTPSLANEAADDFELVGLVERVYVNGNNACIAVCFPPPVTGARVRFYEWTPAGPGALQADHFVPAGDPGLAYDPTDIEDVDVTLPQPFLATGRHYVSVQLEFADCFYWGFWIANKDAPKVGPAYRRTTPGGAWSQVTAFNMQSADLSFSLFGVVDPPAPPLGCGVWTQEPTPNAPGANQSWLNDLAVIAPDDIWAVGRGYGQYTPSDWNQNTLALRYDGTEWSVVPTPNPAPVPAMAYSELNAVAALGPDDVWAAGTREAQDACAGYVGTHNLVIHWDGSAWTQVNAPLPACFGAQGVSGDGIYEILALAPDDVWFLGEWIRMNAQGFTFRHALAMHWNGSGFTVHENFPIVGSNGATIYAADAAGPNDIWAVGAAGDGDPATNQSYIYHWNGTQWSHVPAPQVPGYSHSLGDVKVLAPDDVWISGSSWAPPNTVVQFMLHWDGDGYDFVQVPFAGGTITGEPPTMHVFGSGGVSVFDGATFTDAHLLEGLESLASFGFADVVETGPCEMIAAGSKWIAGDAHTLIARLEQPVWMSLGAAKPGAGALPELLGAGALTGGSQNAVALTGSATSTLAWLIAGTTEANAPFKGGTLVPAPQLVVPFAVGSKGVVGLPFTWPAALPDGTSITLQFWIHDAAASQGASASNALRCTAH